MQTRVRGRLDKWFWIACLAFAGLAQGAVTVSISNKDAMQGATVDIPVYVTGISLSDSLVAYQMKMKYDGTVIQSVGVSVLGTMTANWGEPVSGARNDTLRVGGYTTNQPSKRLVLDDGILLNLRFLVIGFPGSTTTMAITEIRFFNLTGEISISNVTGGTLSVTQNPGTRNENITLYPNWNLISFPLIPSLPTLSVILGGQPVVFVFAYFPGYGPKTWDASRPSFLNDLTSLDGLHGYWMKLNSATAKQWVVNGTPIGVTTPILLAQGWNLISYLPPSPDMIGHSLLSIDPKYSFVMGYDASSGSPKTWDRQRPAFLNDLNALVPLWGYWIKMDEAKTLTYPGSGYVLSKNSGSSVRVEPESAAAAGIPQWCDFWSVQSNVYQIGDTIKVMDSKGVLCGKTVVSKKDMFLISVMGDDPSTPEDEGASADEAMRFRLNQDSLIVVGASSLYDSVIVAGKTATWEAMGSKRIELKRTGSAVLLSKGIEATTLPETPVLFGNYPNPFNATTVIGYRLDKATAVFMGVYDMQGRLIRTLMEGKPQQAGVHAVVWDAKDNGGRSVSSGVYICRMEAGRVKLSAKMVLLY
jgi:hypothetical protein